MTASTKSPGAVSAGGGEYSVRKQIDALASGEIDTATFLRAALQRFRFDSEESWETLSLLDQYHRLGKIPTEVFREVKVTIGEYAWRPRDANGKPLAKFNLPDPAPVTTDTKPPPAARQSAVDSAQAPASAREVLAKTPKPASPSTDAVSAPGPAPYQTPPQAAKHPKPLRQAVSENLHSAPEEPQTAAAALRESALAREAPPAGPGRLIVEPDTSTPRHVEASANRETTAATYPILVEPEALTPPRNEPPAARDRPANGSADTEPETLAPPLREPVIAREAVPAYRRPVTAEPESYAEPVRAEAPNREAVDVQPREIRAGNMLRRRYRIEGVIGSGAVGTVYEATDSFRLEMPPSGQRIAIKVFHPQFSRRIETLTELRRDFQVMQSLSHPNILRAFEFERDHQLAFVTTEFLNGVTLERVLAARSDRPLQRPHALAIIRDIGAAIAYAHSRGVVHGDINPNAIFLTARGELRVADFAAAHKQPNSAFAADNESFGTTAASPGFASPQVLENDRPRVQDDIYSLACLAVMLLGGRHPFDGRGAMEARIARVRPRRPQSLTGRQWRALRNALRFERDKRPTEMQEWLSHLGLERATRRLPPVNDLVEAPPRTPYQFGIGSAFAACILAAAACYFVAVENDWIAPVSLDQLRAALSPAQTERTRPRPDVDTQTPPTVAPPAARAARPATTERTTPKITKTQAVPAGSSPSTAGTTLPGAAAKHATQASPALKPAPDNTTSTGGAVAAVLASHAKIEMMADSLEVQPGGMAKVVVHRKGSLRGATTFQWWTESGTAKPGKDFVPVLPRVEQMADGQATAVLVVSVADGVRTRDKSFYVEIDSTDGGAEISGRTLTMVTLPANN